MNSSADRYRVAVVQAEPDPHCLAASMEKALDRIRCASSCGAQLICFGETFLSGYPAWLDFCPEAALWDNAVVKDVFAALRSNSVVVGGPETEALCQISSELRVTLVIGANERVQRGPGHGTLYNSLLFFAEGELRNVHRKLVPTFSERLVWGQGDAAGMRCIESGGIQVGGLICWEHWMPLARQHMHNQGEQIHVAVWPTVHEMHQVASRHYAFEGRCFVLAAGQVMRASALPRQLSRAKLEIAEALIESGGSAIIAPNGSYMAGPLYSEEGILYADLDLTEIDRENMTLDVTGHYSRPDIFRMAVSNRIRD